MNRRLSAQGRKSISDVLRRKAHSIVILLAILIPVGGFTAVSVAGDSLSSAYAFSVGTHGNRQDTVTDSELPEDARQVRLDRWPAQIQPCSELGVRQPAREQRQDLPFTLGQ